MCYAEIRPGTEVDMQAIFTQGIVTCCGVYVTNPTNTHMFLCHADTLIDLAHEQHGIPAWIRKIREGDADGTITVGYTDNKDYFFDIKIQKLIDEEKWTNVEHERHDPIYSIMLERERGVYENPDLNKMGYEIINSPILRHYTHSNILNNISRENGIEESVFHEPMCIYDGQHFLSIEEIQQNHPFVNTTPEYSDEEELESEISFSESKTSISPLNILNKTNTNSQEKSDEHPREPSR